MLLLQSFARTGNSQQWGVLFLVRESHSINCSTEINVTYFFSHILFNFFLHLVDMPTKWTVLLLKKMLWHSLCSGRLFMAFCYPLAFRCVVNNILLSIIVWFVIMNPCLRLLEFQTDVDVLLKKSTTSNYESRGCLQFAPLSINQPCFSEDDDFLKISKYRYRKKCNSNFLRKFFVNYIFE